jgi:GT2 family glycosyltransferase
MRNTKYENYKIYIADTGSDESQLKLLKKHINESNTYPNEMGEDGKCEIIEYDYYNFAKINNDVVKNKIDSDTELLLFCNNDIEMLNDAISIMVNIHNDTKKIGTVGCRLHYEDGSVQHLGVSLQVNDKDQLLITHKYIRWDNENIRASKSESYTHGNTAAFMMVSKDLFLEIGCFNEDYTECFEDVEFNLRCLLKNKVNVTTNKAVCYHLESQTRDRTGEEVDLQMLLKFINSNPIIKKTFNKIN